MASRKRSISNDSDVSALYKEWDEVSCPICMDHPHNAVLLICSSHDKGCRSYICDTSYRHSNCLDRFKKTKEGNADGLSGPPSMTPERRLTSAGNLENWSDGYRPNHTVSGANTVVDAGLPGGSGGHSSHDVNQGSEDVESNMGKFEEGSSLQCPLCRGSVLGWKVMVEARQYLNLKSRSCSSELCPFTGNYRELRRHARRVHPTVHPADIDPSRQRAWRRLEDQREYNDIVSAIHSAMPGAVVFGDYVIENGDRLSAERDRGRGRWLSTFFLFHMIGSMESEGGLRGSRPRVFPRHRRASGRRYLWGENLLGHPPNNEDEEEDNEQELNILSDHGDNTPPHPRRRRRLTHDQSEEDQQ